MTARGRREAGQDAEAGLWRPPLGGDTSLRLSDSSVSRSLQSVAAAGRLQCRVTMLSLTRLWPLDCFLILSATPSQMTSKQSPAILPLLTHDMCPYVTECGALSTLDTTRGPIQCDSLLSTHTDITLTLNHPDCTIMTLPTNSSPTWSAMYRPKLPYSSYNCLFFSSLKYVCI